MNIPNVGMAYVSEEKLSSYLLSMTHPVGKSKAKLLRSIGFNDFNINRLKQGLIEIAKANKVVERKISVYETKYVINGKIQSPNNVEIGLRTIWIIDVDGDIPRFVTAYPL